MKTAPTDKEEKIKLRKWLYKVMIYIQIRGIFFFYFDNGNPEKIYTCYNEGFSPENAVNYVFGEMA